MADDHHHVIHVSHDSHSPPPPPPPAGPTIPEYPMEFPPPAQTHHTHHQHHHTYQEYGYESQPLFNRPLHSDPHHKPATQGNYWIFFAFIGLFLVIWYLSENSSV